MIERRQSQLAKLNDAEERWMRKLLRAAHEVEKIRARRKRLLGPRKAREIKYRSLDEIRNAASGYEFNDEIPS